MVLLAFCFFLVLIGLAFVLLAQSIAMAARREGEHDFDPKGSFAERMLRWGAGGLTFVGLVGAAWIAVVYW